MNNAPDSNTSGAGADREVDHAWLVLYQQGSTPRTIDLIDELTIGRLLDTTGIVEIAGHLSVTGDPAVSRLHAVLSRKAPGWCVQSAASSNGLFVNGRRLAAGAVQLLGTGDEMRMGDHTTIVFHCLSRTAADRSYTQTARGIPDLTPAERRVLLCLCSPVLDGDAFTPPASVPAIASELCVTDSAVKQQLGRLYLKFGIDGGSDRRVRLANDALTCGAVRRADLEAHRSAT